MLLRGRKIVEMKTEHNKKLSCRRDCAPLRVIDIFNTSLSHSRSFKVVPFERLDAVSYSPFIVTIALSCMNGRKHV